MCMITTPAPLRAITPAMRGSKLNPLMSLMMSAPAASAASATSAFQVSTESGQSKFCRSAAITGSTRSISSAAETGSEPGRVDSPPTSRMSAPSSIRSLASARAAVVEK